MKIRLVLSAAALVLSASAGMAATSDISSQRRADFYAAGTHKFYAWCSGGQDRLVTQEGLSAKDAEIRFSEKTSGQANCRLSWRGRIKS